MRALIVVAVPLAALAALGGAYPSSTFPLLLAAAAAFLICGPRDIASPSTRVLDTALLIFLIAIAAQLLPLPPWVVALISPNAGRLQRVISIAIPMSTRTLSVDARLTRDGLASTASAVMVFWAARDTFGRGGLRLTGRILAIAGAVAALAGMAQRVTSPHLLLWTWTPIDPGAQPYGPFVNRNHFATWLLMIAAVTLGYAVAHIRSHRLLESPSLRLKIRDLLTEATGLLLVGCAAATTVGLIAAGSRGALLGTGAAVMVGALLARRRGRGVGYATAMLLIAALVAAAVVVNFDVIAQRLPASTEVSRTTIWRETLPIVRDFPVAGTGLGTYAETMLIYQQSKSELLFNQAHDEYLQLASEGGLLLLIPAIVALVAWTRLSWRRLESDRRDLLWMRVGAAAGIVGVAVQCIWESALRMPANAMLLALLAAIVVHDRRESAVSQR